MLQMLYFGHPINAYDTELEKILISRIYLKFPKWFVINPNRKYHAAGYKRYVDSGRRGMDYYFEEVLPQCHGGIFLPFRDGKFGAGVFGEAEFLKKRGYPIWQIDLHGNITELALDPQSLLSVEETRARVRMPDGTMKPY